MVNLTGSDACRIIASLLKGKAQTWWRMYSEDAKQSGYSSVFDTLDEDTMLQDLEEQFSDSDKQMRLKEKLLKIRQLGDVQSYTNLFKNLQTELGANKLDEDTALHVYQHGLKPDTKEKVMLERPQTFNEATRTANTYDCIRNTLRGNSGGFQQRGGFQNRGGFQYRGGFQ